MCSSHLWKSHNIDLGLLFCPKCKFKSASFGKLLINDTLKICYIISRCLGRLKVHLALHDEAHPFICHECGKGFKQLSQLKNHLVIHKDPETDEVFNL